MSRLGDLALDVEPEYAFCAGRPAFAHSEFGRVAGSRVSIAQGLYGDLRIRRRPVQREIVKKPIPSFKFVAIHITPGKRESMIDPDDHSLIGRDRIGAVLADLCAGPISRTRGRCCSPFRHPTAASPVHLQTLEPSFWSAGAGIVDTNIMTVIHLN